MSFSSRQDVVDFVTKETNRAVKRAMDKEFTEDARKLKMYDRVSRHVGAFDYEGMSLKEMAAHAAKKLSIELREGDDPVSAVEGYLKGRADSASGSGMDGFRRTAQDSTGVSFLDKYLKGDGV